MKRDKGLISKRKEYVKNRINNSKNIYQEIKKLSNELFISVRTIERDLKE